MGDFIPWFVPAVGENEIKQLTKVIESNYINDGEITREFEREVAKIIGVKHSVGVTNGTTAIAAALMGLGIGKNDKVLVPNLTFIATANAVRLTGAEVVLIDVEPDRFTIDICKAKEKTDSEVKAIVSVDVNGRGCNYEELETFCDEKNLNLICDSAEAFGSKFQGRYLGTFGKAGCFSFSPNKTVTCGQGGLIVTNDTSLYHRLLELKDQGRREQGTGGDDFHPVMGYNFKLTNLQAAVGLAQLKLLPKRLKQFQKRDSLYRERLADRCGIKLPSIENGEICQWMDILIENRDKVFEKLTKKGIGCRPFWFPIHTQTPYRQADKDYENSIKVSSQGIWLPSYFDITEEEIDKVCHEIYRVAG